jgi:hypothetical protein
MAAVKIKRHVMTHAAAQRASTSKHQDLSTLVAAKDFDILSFQKSLEHLEVLIFCYALTTLQILDFQADSLHENWCAGLQSMCRQARNWLRTL